MRIEIGLLNQKFQQSPEHFNSHKIYNESYIPENLLLPSQDLAIRNTEYATSLESLFNNPRFKAKLFSKYPIEASKLNLQQSLAKNRKIDYYGS